MEKRKWSQIIFSATGILFLVLVLYFIQIYSMRKPYKTIPIEWMELPEAAITKVKIDGYPCRMQIDLGFPNAFSLQERYLKRIRNKSFLSMKQFINMKGVLAETPIYLLGAAQVNGISFSGQLLLEEEKELDDTIFVTSESLRKRSALIRRKYIDGMLGAGLFEKHVCFFDFPNSRILLSQKLDAFIKNKEDLEKYFAQIPFDLCRKGIILSLTTDLGEKKFFLDTGATHSTLRKSLVPSEFAFEEKKGQWMFKNNALFSNGKDLGPCTFFLYELTDLIQEFDGILGLEFFKEHEIYLDFPNRMAYIPARL